MKIKYYLFVILTSLSFCNLVNAATLELKTDDKLVINYGENTIILVNAKDIEEEVISQIEFDLNYDKEVLSVKVLDNEFGYSQNINKDNIFINKARKETITDGSILSFSVTNISKNEEDSKTDISLQNVKINDSALAEEEITKLKPISITLKKNITTTTKALNTSAELKGFKANNNATIKPAFSKDIKEYKIYVKDTLKQVTITTQSEESGVKAEIECNLGCSTDTNEVTSSNDRHIIKFNVNQGKNEATIKFTSEDGKNNVVYKFIIYRGATTDGSNLLSDLKFEENIKLNEKFDKSNLDYTVKVPYDIESLKVVATPEDSNANVEIKGNDKLVVGENVITITVTSTETMEKKIYNVTVTREEFVPKEENDTVVTPVIEKDEPKSSSNNIKLIIIIGVISTLIIGLAAYFIFFYKGKNKKAKIFNQKEENESILANELIDEDLEPTSVEDALKDLMKTREMIDVKDDKPTD